MARYTARLTKPTRASPERPAPSATISSKFLCDDGTCFLRAAARQHLLFTIDIGFDGAPFRRKLSGDGFGFHAEYRWCLLIALRRSILSHCLPRIVDDLSCFEIAGVERNDVARLRQRRKHRSG